MKLEDKVVVVTGGARGIGEALARRFASEGARAVVVADLDGDEAARVARDIDGSSVGLDVTSEPDVVALVEETLGRYGRIDLFCSNAGALVSGGVETPDPAWNRLWGLHVMAHVYAARAVLPGMLARGDGYLLQVASAAGVLSIPDASYAVTKHAAVAFAEWLSITYGARGIKVSCFCPQGVRTRLLVEKPGSAGDSALIEGAISPAQAAEAVVRGLESERFLILSHPEVLEYMRRKTADYDRWLRGMRRHLAAAER